MQRDGGNVFRFVWGSLTLETSFSFRRRDEERAERAYVEGEAEDGGGRVRAGEDKGEGGACEYVKKRGRGAEITSREWLRGRE